MTDEEAIAWLLERCNNKDAPTAETEVRRFMLEDAEDPDDPTTVFSTVLNHHDRLATAVSKRLSRPTFSDGGAADDFPSWSNAEWIATWNTRAGIAYVAIMSRWCEDRTITDDEERLPYRLLVGITQAPKPESWLRRLWARRKAQPRLPRLPTGKTLVTTLDRLAKGGPAEQRDVVAASKDFFEDRDGEAFRPTWQDAYQRTRAALVETLGTPLREEAFPEWFPEAEHVAEWTWGDRIAFLALHQDDAELPVMLTLGLRARG